MPALRRLGRTGAFWASASVLALVLWSSGAPSVLYPIYAQKWNLSPAIITLVFAAYQLALIVVLPVFGNLSDQFGRRLVMIWGVALIAASAVMFAIAPNVTFLFVGRVLQGAGSGLAMGAATASLVENNSTGNARFASSLATVSTAAGLTLALVFSGVFARFIPMPLFWSYVLLLGLTITAGIALALTPHDRPSQTRRWRPQALRLAPGLRLSFSIATLSVSLAYCVGAIFLSLGAHMIGQFTHTTNAATVGVLLGCSSAAIGATGLLLARIRPLVSVLAGTLLTLVSLGLMAAAATFGSIGLFLAWCLVGGVAYSFAFTGGLGVINQATTVHHRGTTLSLLYLIAYVLQAATAIGMGALATAGTLGTAISVASAVIAGLCLVSLMLIILGARTRRSAAR
ncbi:MFS transporter [Brevibacterium sp. UCMA 11752]|uniref:MFS transporter n=1 Tax=Brevibacterium sp. UCMA 11752 TaxID=2745946 RepID=UPI001F4441E3|nr:MFS transporter [Brevibacterium sp. UCMA 11752]MCF2589299.1 MFS transporter [Brevibacterium sp. UCMA 11752]